MGSRINTGSFSSVLQAVCCAHCREILNGHWFYNKTLPPFNDPNPFAGRCRNCGSREFTVGSVPAVTVFRLEREGWWILPFMHDLNIRDPFCKYNLFDMKAKEAV
jgi:hypothetical protein